MENTEIFFKLLFKLFNNGIPYLVEQVFTLFRSWPFVVFLMFLHLKNSLNDLILRTKNFYCGNRGIEMQLLKNSQGETSLVEKMPLENTYATQEAEGKEINNKEVTTGAGKLEQNKSDPQEKTPPAEKVPLPELNPIYAPIVQEAEEVIKDEVQNSSYDKDDFLIRDNALLQIYLTFERIYFYIFKSQFNTLQMLNSLPDGAFYYELIPFYEGAKQRYPREYSNYSFENWFAFFYREGFVSGQQNNKYYSTNKTSAFVNYIYQRGYNPQKNKYF